MELKWIDNPPSLHRPPSRSPKCRTNGHTAMDKNRGWSITRRFHWISRIYAFQLWHMTYNDIYQDLAACPFRPYTRITLKSLDISDVSRTKYTILVLTCLNYDSFMVLDDFQIPSCSMIFSGCGSSGSSCASRRVASKRRRIGSRSRRAKFNSANLRSEKRSGTTFAGCLADWEGWEVFLGWKMMRLLNSRLKSFEVMVCRETFNSSSMQFPLKVAIFLLI